MDKNMKILIVDDFDTMRRIIKNLLRDLGFTNTQEADSAESAWDELKSKEYGFLIMDSHLPDMTGIELIKKVRADESLRSLPILLVTSEPRREEIVEAARAGANGYVVKPFTAAVLKEKIDKIFERVEG